MYANTTSESFENPAWMFQFCCGCIFTASKSRKDKVDVNYREEGMSAFSTHWTSSINKLISNGSAHLSSINACEAKVKDAFDTNFVVLILKPIFFHLLVIARSDFLRVITCLFLNLRCTCIICYGREVRKGHGQIWIFSESIYQNPVNIVKTVVELWGINE